MAPSLQSSCLSLHVPVCVLGWHLDSSDTRMDLDREALWRRHGERSSGNTRFLTLIPTAVLPTQAQALHFLQVPSEGHQRHWGQRVQRGVGVADHPAGRSVPLPGSSLLGPWVFSSEGAPGLQAPLAPQAASWG